MEDYRLDRSHFQMLTLKEADEEWNDHFTTGLEATIEVGHVLE